MHPRYRQYSNHDAVRNELPGMRYLLGRRSSFTEAATVSAFP